ncbi:MAG: hypothetical protein JJU13_19905 [Balneolaceae bacterium]|nr:hypothetical protein [Balneolaceae bacterium]
MVKLIFIVVMIWLPLQYGIVGIVGYYHSEPWPAFVFPGFKSVHVFEEGFEIGQTRFEVYREDGEELISLQPQQLFSEIPLSQVPGFMRAHFHDDESIREISAEGRFWLRFQVQQAAGIEPNAMDVVQYVEYYSHHPEGAVKDSTAEVRRTSILFGER